MTVEMTKYKLYEIADYVSSKVSTSQLSLQDYVTTDCLLQNKCGRECAKNLPPQCTNVTAYKPGDILISNIRPYLKKIWYADSEGGNSADVLTIRAKEGFENQYMYYALFQDSFFDYASKGVTGSKMPRGDKDRIMNFEILVPKNLKSQKKIASILSDFDKRIENLRAQNRVLEQTAKTIYDYTFLQCSGHQTTYNKTLNRNIPTDWEVKKLGELVEINDSTIRKNDFEDILYLETSGIVNNRIEEVSSLKYSNAPSRAKRKVKDRTIVYSTVRPEQRHFGILLNPPSNLIVSTGFVTIDAKKDVGDVSFFLYSFLSQDSTIRYLNTIAENSVSSYPSLNPSDIENLFIACPDSQTLEKFNMEVTPLFQKQQINAKQIEALTTQRNTLLPLLMTGQIEVM